MKLLRTRLYFDTMRTPLIAVTILMLTACCQQRFNSEKWKTEEDLKTYPFRDGLLAYILENKIFIGLQYQQVIDSLGWAF